VRYRVSSQTAPASCGGFFMLALPAGVNLFGLNHSCPLTCGGICSGFGQPAPWFGICSGSGLPSSGSGCSGFGLLRFWQQIVRVGAPSSQAAAENPNICSQICSWRQAQRSVLTAKKIEQLFFFYYTMKRFSCTVIE